MGNSLTCPCSEPAKEGVLVMRGDGSLIQCKKGIHAKELVGANPGFRVVRCDSERTVLWSSAELESNRLYFLMPEDKARCQGTFEKFWKVGEEKGLVPHRIKGKGDVRGPLGSMLFDGSAEFRRLPWTPQLRTIPEVLSPPLVGQLKEESCQGCSLGEQIASSPMIIL